MLTKFAFVILFAGLVDPILFSAIKKYTIGIFNELI